MLDYFELFEYFLLSSCLSVYSYLNILIYSVFVKLNFNLQVAVVSQAFLRLVEKLQSFL